MVYLVSLVSVFGNGVIIASFCKFAQVRSCGVLLLLSQAVADLCLALGVSVTVTIQLLKEFDVSVLTAGQCLAGSVPFILGDRMSQMNILFIALERLVAVVRPVRYRAISETFFVKLCVAVAIPYCAAMAASAFVNTKIPLDAVLPANVSCQPPLISSTAVVCTVLVTNFAVGITLVVLYVCAVVVLRKKAIGAHDQSHAVLTVEKRVQKTVTAVVTVYAVCFFVPAIGLGMAMKVFSSYVPKDWLKCVLIFGPCGSVINSASNFFIYLAKHKELRQGIVKVLKGQNFATQVAVLKNSKHGIGGKAVGVNNAVHVNGSGLNSRTEAWKE